MNREHKRASPEWVADILDGHRERFRRFVQVRVPPEDVDDVLQAAALRAVERCGTLDDPERVLPWLYRLHRNVVVDTLRRRASRQRLVDESAAAVDSRHVETEGICGCSRTQAKQINPAYASVLALVDEGEATLAEAAEVLGISVTNAGVRLHRARKALRRQMQKHCGVESVRDCVSCICVSRGCCAA